MIRSYPDEAKVTKINGLPKSGTGTPLSDLCPVSGNYDFRARTNSANARTRSVMALTSIIIFLIIVPHLLSLLSTQRCVPSGKTPVRKRTASPKNYFNIIYKCGRAVFYISIKIRLKYSFNKKYYNQK